MRRELEAARGAVLAATVASIIVAAAAGPAAAGTTSGGSRSCASTQAVTTSSKSSGWTSHTIRSGTQVNSQYYSVSASSPYRNWATGKQSVSSWTISGDVLESANAACKARPA